MKTVIQEYIISFRVPIDGAAVTVCCDLVPAITPGPG